MAIAFQNQNTRFSLKEKSRLKDWISRVIAAEKKTPGRLDFVFTSDEELLKVNIQFLNHDTYTDILTFDESEGNVIRGDILISVDRVKDNAAKFGVDFQSELKRVMIHGILHLCGYKDKSKVDAAVMRTKEEQALRKF